MDTFPQNFLWGAAASAPQTEGAALVDGKSPSTWDKWFEIEPELFITEQDQKIPLIRIINTKKMLPV